jgi:hypothetical protein
MKNFHPAKLFLFAIGAMTAMAACETGKSPDNGNHEASPVRTLPLTTCAPGACGPPPPVPPCPDGSAPTVTCEACATGVCGWHAVCPPSPAECGAGECGPPPPVPPCPNDPSTPRTATCSRDEIGAVCTWHVSPCPPPAPVCQITDCGPVPPLAPCVPPASRPPNPLTCEWNTNACSWRAAACVTPESEAR